MHRKIVVVVASVLFALLSVVALVFGDLLDRSYPVQLGARALVSMDFEGADVRDAVALRDLGELSDRFDMGLVRVLPELGGDQSREVFALVGTSGPRAREIPRFGEQPPSRVVGRDALAFSFSDGTYLLTGSNRGDGALRAWLQEHRVVSHWEDSGPAQIFKLAVRQPPFVIAFLAAFSLMASLVLYWTATRARARALRVLAGVPSVRIQYEDIGTFVWLVSLPAAAVGVLATIMVSLARGARFTWYYASLMAGFELAVLAVAVLGALVITSTSWPSERVLATRTPPVGSLAKIANVVMAGTFVLVLSAIGPALQAQNESAGAAAQQARWKALADQVLLNFPSGLGETGFERIRGRVKDVIVDAEGRDAVAMSYAVSPEALDIPPSAMGGYEEVALVNQRWLTLMSPRVGSAPTAGGDASEGVLPLTPGQIPQAVRGWLDASVPLWVPGRDAAAVKAWWAAVKVRSYSSASGMAFALGGDGDLVFPRTALVLVVDDLGRHFDADFLASLATSRNLTLAGLDATIGLLQKHGLRNDLQVRYVAEAGILRAQLAAYAAWLDTVSLVALAVAFIMATGVGTLLSGLLSARRDFPLRLAGRGWPEILGPRLVKECSVGVVLLAAALVFRRDYAAAPVMVLALGGLLVLVVMHLCVSRWAFINVSLRKL